MSHLISCNVCGKSTPPEGTMTWMEVVWPQGHVDATRISEIDPLPAHVCSPLCLSRLGEKMWGGR